MLEQEMVEWGVSSKCHSAQAPVSLARVTSYNYNYNCNYNYNYNYSLARVTSYNCARSVGTIL